MTGEELYQTACAACHGSDGKGQPRLVVGFDTPLPDFTDCAFTTPEADLDWWSVVHEGGRVRALDRRMPAFGDALSERRNRQRSSATSADFCTEPGVAARRPEFPAPVLHRKGLSRERGGLHHRDRARAGSVGRARSSSTSIASASAPSTRSTSRSRSTRTSPARWSRGLGDINVALKYALYDSLRARPHRQRRRRGDAARPATNRAGLAAA